LDEILKRLQLDYLDLYLIHWPMGFKEDAGDYPVGPNGNLNNFFLRAYFTFVNK